MYANNDEFGALLFHRQLHPDQRVSDAGEDLSYLFFYKDHPEESARLEGFTTTDRLNLPDFDPLHDPATVKSPVAGVIVELKSDRLQRYAQSDKNGRFLFDGLGKGDYQVSAYASGYPLNAQLLAGPKRLRPRSALRCKLHKDARSRRFPPKKRAASAGSADASNRTAASSVREKGEIQQ